MAGDPADVGGAPVDVAVVVVEHVLVRDGGVDEVAAGGVQHALRLAGGARRIEDEQRVLGVHLDGRAVGRNLGQLLVEPDVARRVPRHGLAGAAHDEHFLAALGDLVERLVGVLLQWDVLAAAQALVRGDDELGVRVVDAPGEAVGREPAEYDRVHRADAGAREHGVGGLGDHRQVDRDAVALLRPRAPSGRWRTCTRARAAAGR